MTKVVKGSDFVGLHFNLVLEKRIQVFTSTVSILQRKDKIKWDNSIRWGWSPLSACDCFNPPFFPDSFYVLSCFPVFALFSWFWLIPCSKRSRSAGKLLKRNGNDHCELVPCAHLSFEGSTCAFQRYFVIDEDKCMSCILGSILFCFVLKQFVFSSATGLMFSTIWISIPPCWGWNKGDVHFSFSLSVNRLFVGNKGCQYAPHTNVWEKRYGNGTFYCRYALYADFMKLVN